MDDLQAEADKVLAAGALGRSPVVHRLFEFLVERSRSEPAPKEMEVAEAVFGRTANFDVSQDSTVRVYVHRLRGKLDDYYRGPGRDEPMQLSIPKGEYRLVLAPADPAQAEAALRRRTLPPWVMPAVAILVALNVIVGGALWWTHNMSGFAFARHSPAWAEVIHDDRPMILVVGDYYIFGEADEHAEVIRMIREYTINSADDLAEYLMNNPELVGKYTDLDLHYLPTSIATALRNLMPLLAETPKERERIRVVSASQLTSDMIKRNNIIYVGYISGLGLLRDPVFAGSRFKIGETYDEIIDQTTAKTYHSQEGPKDTLKETRLDYGYFASFDGPEGNHIIVIAGTRDVAVMHTAEALSSRAGISEIKKKTKGKKPFEALYEVEALDRLNLRGKMLLLSERSGGDPWQRAAQPPMP